MGEEALMLRVLFFAALAGGTGEPKGKDVKEKSYDFWERRR